MKKLIIWFQNRKSQKVEFRRDRECLCTEPIICICTSSKPPLHVIFASQRRALCKKDCLMFCQKPFVRHKKIILLSKKDYFKRTLNVEKNITQKKIIPYEIINRMKIFVFSFKKIDSMHLLHMEL